MASGPLRILDFLNRGAMDRRLGPDWKQKEEDRQLHNSLLMEGNSRADITSALVALDKLDELKTKGLAEDVNMAGAAPMPGESQRDAYIREEAARREELRRATLNHIGAQTDLERAQGKALDKNFTVTPDEAAALKKAGVDLTPGAVIDDNVLAAITQLQGHRIQASAQANALAARTGKPSLTIIRNSAGENRRVWTSPDGSTVDVGPAPLGATSANRADAAEALISQGADIKRSLMDKNTRDTLGPALGRYSNLRDFIGNPPPEFSNLAGELESFALANMGVHGMRSVQGAEKISRLLDAHHTPESLVAAIDGLLNFSHKFVMVTSPGFDPNASIGGGLPPPSPSPASGGLSGAIRDFLAKRGGQ